MTNPTIGDTLEQLGLELAASHTIEGRAAQRRDVPRAILPAVQEAIVRQAPDGLYSHQAEAIELSLGGEDVCLATPTASGKTLAFLATGFDAVLRDPKARVLALYPAKALIHDQRGKWDSMAAQLNVRVGRIDGTVPVADRTAILSSCRIILMTPDVLHAWVMANTTQPAVAAFLRSVHVVVLDEAHVYDGVFGTNMAYLLRRFSQWRGPSGSCVQPRRSRNQRHSSSSS